MVCAMYARLLLPDRGLEQWADAVKGPPPCACVKGAAIGPAIPGCLPHWLHLLR